MLQTRLIVGTLLVILGLGVLLVDSWFAPWFPLLLVFALLTTLALAYELRHLLPEATRPRAWVLYGGMALIIMANWSVPLRLPGNPLVWPAGAVIACLWIAFLIEARFYREPGNVTARLANTFLCWGYLGLFVSCLIQLRWYPGLPNSTPNPAGAGTLALLLAIFVPKCGDIGAYFTGRLLGRHSMTPLLSPKKTWEGAVGGLLAAAAASILITHGLASWFSLDSTERPAFPLRLAHLAGVPGWVWSLAAGLLIGLAGMLGDLVESLLKRDARQKDAAETVPGFGGLLDVFDAIVFSAPATYVMIHGLDYLVRTPG